MPLPRRMRGVPFYDPYGTPGNSETAAFLHAGRDGTTVLKCRGRSHRVENPGSALVRGQRETVNLPRYVILRLTNGPHGLSILDRQDWRFVAVNLTACEAMAMEREYLQRHDSPATVISPTQ